MKFFAVCNANGPISVELDGETIREALESFAELDGREAIDNARTDIEDELGFCGEGLDDSEMDQRLKDERAYPVRSLQSVINGHSMREYHETDGWYLWATCDSLDIDELRTEAEHRDDRLMVEACENADASVDAWKKCLEALIENAAQG